MAMERKATFPVPDLRRFFIAKHDSITASKVTAVSGDELCTLKKTAIAHELQTRHYAVLQVLKHVK